MKNKILIGLIVFLVIFNTGLIFSLFATPKSKLPSRFTKCYQEQDFYVVYDNSTKVMYSVSKNGELTMLYTNHGNPLEYTGK